MKYNRFIPFVFSLVGFLVSAQNLVRNPSFEDYTKCPKHLDDFNNFVANWSTASYGTSDYFNSCSDIMGVPKNFNGYQNADFGNAYAGLYVYAPEDYREYLQAELKQTLQKDQEYKISFYISWADKSGYVIKDFGLLFSQEKLKIATKKVLSGRLRYKVKGNKYNLVEVKSVNFHEDVSAWVLVSINYVAKGNENFMILGNFKNNARTSKKLVKEIGRKGAYYYVDMVSVEPVVVVNEEEVFELNTTHIFKTVLFDFDSITLRKEAEETLQTLYNQLKADAKLALVIHGHTDNEGSKRHNRRLSNNRAKVVVKYLLALGLSKDRVEWMGHGSEKSLKDNVTVEGRQENRRVEFVISKRD
ncbi:MAG: OmpA family protein [Cellulophaga sp.]